MISFISSIVLLILGYIFYGAFVEKVFGIKEERATPAKEYADGVDFVEIPKSKAYLIQFLNIAGTGPIFGAIAGALWGPASFLWIVFGCIFAGATHDFLIGMMSLRSKGQSISELIGQNLGGFAKWIMRAFSVILLILVGVVFINSPAMILSTMTGQSTSIFIAVIIVYYVLATVLPIDKIIVRVYPIFGIALLVMALGIFFSLLTGGYDIPEVSLSNVHPKGTSIFPFLFITIACGAISGFHATQAPLMARCMSNEREGRLIFYGAMITEGIVALIWAAAAMTFYGGVEALAEAGTAPVVVNDISIGMMGSLGGILAVLGVVAAPVSSGDTAFRSARLNLADMIGLKQGPIKNRFIIAIPLFIIGISLTFIDFFIIWRYFAWSNQTLATVALWTASVYLMKRGKNYFISFIPAIFMTVVVTTYILIAPEGFQFIFGSMDTDTIEVIGVTVGIIHAIFWGAFFIVKNKTLKGTMLDQD